MTSKNEFIDPKTRNVSGRKMQIIGIDPGLRKTGWGIVNVDGNIISHENL